MSVLPAQTSGLKQYRPMIAWLLSVVLITLLLSTTLTQVPVQAVNPPVAYDDAVATNEDTPTEITLNASDEDGDELYYTIVTAPIHGTLSGTLPYVTYTPDPDYNGSDSFTFQANDGDQSSNIATVSINVLPVNDAPVADEQAVDTDEDTALPIVLTGSDVDGDTLTFVIVSQPSNGALSGTAPNVTYAPHADYNGSDSFTFKVNDGTQDSNIAAISITVNPVEDPPVADGQSVLTARNTPKAITLSASDADGDALTFSIMTGPANGILTGTAPNLTYTPNPDFGGSDSFTFLANDGDQDSNIATVSITVNDPPVAHDQAVTTDEDMALPIVLTASDTEGDALTYAIVDGPNHGVLTGTEPNLTYVPGTDYYGSDSFTFKVNDTYQDSNIATVSITVDPVEDAPVADDQSVTTDEDTAKAIILTATDPDGDDLAYSIVAEPTHGTLSGTAPNITYTPSQDYYGADSFTFKANDGKQDSNIATISVTVHPVNDPPIAHAQAVTMDEDTALSIVLTASDVDGDPLTFEITTPPTHGTLSGAPPTLTYTPFPDYNGTDSVGFIAKDGTSSSETAWITIEIAPVNDPPTANGMTVTVNEDSFENMTLTGNDIDGDPLTFSISTQPLNGSLSGTLPDVTYTPKSDYYGPDSFTFEVRDPAGLTDTAQIQLTVINVNDDPQATDDTATIKEDSENVRINVLHNDTYLPDPFETLTIVSATPPAHGRITILGDGGYIAYTPNRDYYGTDSFTYTISDGNGGSATATVAITVTNVNDPPTAMPDSAEMDEDGGPIEIHVVANDTYLPDPEEELTITGYSRPPNGTVTFAAGSRKSLIYTPNPNYFGTDTFSYTITDNNGGYSSSLVRVTVRPVNDPPVANDDHASTAEDQIVTIDVLANDYDIDSDLDPSSVKVTTKPSHGTTSVNRTTGEITYDPSPNWHGIDILTYQVCDDAKPALCDEAQVDIAVGWVNDPPIANAGPDQTVDTNMRVILDGSGSEDPDGNLPLQYIWTRISGPPVVLTNPNAESPSFIAPDDPCVLVFALTVIDAEGKADLTPDQVTITVKNQPPVSNAGPDKIVQVKSQVSLDGTGSTDPDGDLPLQYLWTQSGGPSVVLSDPTLPTPTFTAPSAASVLTFTLFVTDTFDEPDPTPDQVVITVSEPFYIYLPSVVARHVVAPNLVVESLTATRRNVELVIRNQGNAPVTTAFWVDVYINPERPPAAVNETFDDLGTYGLAWAVINEGVHQLGPGGSLTLRMNDAYYDPDISVFPGNLQPGTPIYAQVDSFNPSTTYGTVREGHELIHGPYDNISGPVLSQEAAAASGEVPPSVERRPKPRDLPNRP